MDGVEVVFTTDSTCRPKIVAAPGREANLPRPAARCRIQYLTEGSANVIFALSVDESAKPATGADADLANLLKHKLLRIPKAAGGLWTQPDSECLEEFKSEELVNQEAVIIDIPMYGVLDDYLSQPSIQTERRGRTDRVWDGTLPMSTPVLGILLIDMTPKYHLGEVTLQFKPKWLVQSLDAPSGAKRCRTCALQASQGSTKTTYHCPINLVAGAPEAVFEQISAIIKARQPSCNKLPYFTPHLTHYFCRGMGREMLDKLKNLQETNAPKDILAFAQDSQLSLEIQQSQRVALRKLSKAMTFRDCTIYVLVSHSNKKPWDTLDGQPSPESFTYEIRIGDLDQKLQSNLPDHVNVKLNQWLKKELQLQNGDYYIGTEHLKDGEKRHSSCYYWY